MEHSTVRPRRLELLYLLHTIESKADEIDAYYLPSVYFMVKTRMWWMTLAILFRILEVTAGTSLSYLTNPLQQSCGGPT